MICLLDCTKFPFILPHAHHAHELLYLPYTVLSQSVLLGLRFIHNSVFSLPPTLCSDWNLCLALSIINYVHYIFSTTRTYFKQIIILFFYCYNYVSLRLIIYIVVLYWTRSHSFIRFRGCGTTVLLPNKRSGREEPPLATLYPTVRLSPWRQVRKNIHSRVWTPGPT